MALNIFQRVYTATMQMVSVSSAGVNGQGIQRKPVYTLCDQGWLISPICLMITVVTYYHVNLLKMLRAFHKL